MNRISDGIARTWQAVRWAFWTTAASAAELAAQHRRTTYRILSYGPFAVTALAAFILGRTLGAFLLG